MGCAKGTFPTKHLGLPLSDSKLPKSIFVPLIQKINQRLTGWAARFLSTAGRILLINTVLSSIPVYYMSVFDLPAWVINEIDRTRRNFLWHGATVETKKIHLANWQLVCTPKMLGGLGVIDLKVFNQALLTKWRWQWHDSKDRAWKKLMKALYCTEGKQHVTNSLLFNHLKETENFCYAQIQWKPRSGDSVIFWVCDWGTGILKYHFPTLYTYTISTEVTLQQVILSTDIKDLFRPVLSLLALDELAGLRTEMQELREEYINHQTSLPDEVRWKTDSEGKFTVKSAYYQMKNGTQVNTNYHRIWKLKAPPRFKVFEWLLQRNKILTTDNLKTRGYNLAGICYMCQASDESVEHLFSGCTYSNGIYMSVMQRGNIQTASLQLHGIRATIDGSMSKKGKSLLVISHFVIWRERCNRVFKEKQKNQEDLIQDIFEIWRTMGRTARREMNSNNREN